MLYGATLAWLALVGPEPPPAKVSLFNGKDLTGWERIGGGKAFVENGLLILEHDAERKAGYLICAQPPRRDFALTLKARVPAGDSGLFFRGERHPLHEGEFQGPQVQLNTAPGLGFGGLFELHGRGWLKRPSSEPRRKPQEWFTLEVRAEGACLTVREGGKTLVDAEDGGADNHFLRAGRFALQIHGGGPVRAEFERLELTPLPGR